MNHDDPLFPGFLKPTPDTLIEEASKLCWKCQGVGRYRIGPRTTDIRVCIECQGRGVLLLNKGTRMDDNQILLSEEEIAAIYMGRVRLANNSAIKQVDDADGNKSYVPIDNEDRNAVMTCNAVNVLDKLLEPYGYKFGAKTLDLLGAL